MIALVPIYSTESPYYPWFSFMGFQIRITLGGALQNLPTVNKLEPSYMKFINDPKPVSSTLLATSWGWWLAFRRYPDEFPDEVLRRITSNC